MNKKIIKEFEEYLKLNNRAEKTIYDRLSCVKYFLLFLRDMNIKNVTDITSSVLKDYRRYLHKYINRKGKEDSPKTINTRVQAVRLFLRFLYEQGYLCSDLSDKVPYIKEPKKLPQITLNNKEIKKILKTCDTSTLMGYRDRVILEVLYSSAIRRNELINLKTEDIDTEGGYLRVNEGKGNKDRVTPLGKIACKYVYNYVTGIRRLLLLNKEDSQWLFLTKNGNKMGETAVRDIIIKTSKKAKIEKSVTTHTYRRSCATEMIKNNANIMHVKDILGHENVSTTQIYARLTINDLKKAHKKYHPREREYLRR
ncbi:MAG: tyrosine-type recombinase/integrase [Candidatus Caldatribacteriota bacterium]|nr:tyrosine-type recombinase/integrase [Candidatus Caldatribacteriota bacterium]